MKSSERALRLLYTYVPLQMFQDISGEYFYNCKLAKTTKWAQSQDDADRLWDLSKNLTGLA